MSNEQLYAKAMGRFHEEVRKGKVRCSGCDVILAPPCQIGIWLPPAEGEKNSATIQAKLGNERPGKYRAVMYGLCKGCEKLYDEENLHLIEEKILRSTNLHNN